MVNKLALFIKELLAHDNYLIVGHENPDPDSIGSMLALYHCLIKYGKRVWMMSADPIPNYQWPNIDKIMPLQEIEYTNIIIVDCEPKRTGKLYPLVKQAAYTFNIDHHQGNKGDCDFNYIDPNQGATCLIIYQLINELSLELSYELAQPLYGGILGDTGGFRHKNTNEFVFRVAADLVRAGAIPDRTAREIFSKKPIELVKFIGYALGKLQTGKNNKLVWLVLSNQDFLNYGVNPQLGDQLIEYARMVDGAEVTVLFREIKPNIIRIGFRSNQININQLAVHFGGGGHLLASGAQMEGNLSEIVDIVINTASLYLEGDVNWMELST